ncbi:MAG: class I adenylate-forming enzyme family protein [Candidatus Binataceae bacterium]
MAGDFTPPPSTFRPITIDAGVRAAARHNAGKIALIEGGRRLDFRTLCERIDRVGTAALADLKLKPGDHAALLAPNCLEFIEIVAGLSSRGIAVAMPSPRLRPAEFVFICDDSRARVLFVHHSLEELARSVKYETVERIIVIGGDYEDWISAASPKAPEFQPEEWTTFAIPYTAGTTGRPKGVLLPHRSRTLTFFGMAVEYGCYSPDDSAIAIAPLCHGAGFAFAMAAIYFGGSCEILARFEPEIVLRKIAESRATNIFMVPTHFHAIFALGARVLDSIAARSLKAIISNAAPLPQATKELIVRHFGAGLLHETYGSTESGTVTNLRPADQLRKIGCVGKPFVCTEVRLLGGGGEDVSPGEVGELFTRSPYLFNGYWRRPAETAAAMRDGWLTVGDLARMDEEGYVYLVDRKDDMIISGGMNVYPREIEEVLYHHPAVLEAAVIGAADSYWGQRIVAFVALRNGAAVSEEELAGHCRRALADYKLPKHVRFIDAIPRNAAGKILKTALREKISGGE